MNALTPNPQTWFLESVTPTFSTFDSAKKMRALEIASENINRGELPSHVKICSALGVSLRTWYEHLQQDTRFKAAWQDILDMAEDRLVNVMYANGQRPSGYMDRITWLRAHNPGKWNPDLKVQVSQHNAHFQNGIGIIEAEIAPKRGEIAENSESPS